MSFLHDRLTEAKAAVDAGNPEKAAEIIGHGLLEGPGTWEENLADMANDEG
ncbi:hypothetical protein AB0B15_39725 [Streptomyces sp. NPDC045456]|uniref:hypothetical protein n=1 Tax=Streptomyces sp. NPDC045456 TaxID=3155254 RepID=UPI0033E80FD3